MAEADKLFLLLHKDQDRLSRDSFIYLFNKDLCDMKDFKNSLGKELILMLLASVKYSQAHRSVK